MEAEPHPDTSRRRRAAAVGLSIAVVLLGGGLLTAGAATKYKKLGSIGVKADRAVIQARTVGVRIAPPRP